MAFCVMTRSYDLGGRESVKIGLDVTHLGINTTDKGGVFHYMYELVSALKRIDTDNTYCLFFNFFRKEHLPTFLEASRLLQGQNFYPVRSRFPSKIYYHFPVPVEFIAGRFDVFHSLSDFSPCVISAKAVVTVHDLRYLDMPESLNHEYIDILRLEPSTFEENLKGYSERLRFFKTLQRSIRRTVNRADQIITVSEYSKNNIMKLLNVSTNKIHTIHHGVSGKFFKNYSKETGDIILARYGISRKYILYVGKMDPLKNLLRLIEAFHLIKKMGTSDCDLVLAGPSTWFSPIVLRKVKSLGIEKNIIFTDYVSDDDLPILYQRAEVFCFPSLYEGFGIPVLEAMASGTPVICSNICSLPEVIGEAGMMVDPFQVDNIAEAMHLVLTDDNYRNQLSGLGKKRAAEFTWDKAAKATLEVYRNACSKQ